MTQVRLDVLNPKGQVVGSLVSQDGVVIMVDGSIKGAHNFSYHQRGNVIDKEGELTFTVPLNVARNDALAAGNQLVVYEDGVAMNQFVITTNSETLAANGREAQYTCPDLLDELRRTSVTSGFVADLGHQNTGPPDPIPTRPGETLLQTYNRLLNIRYLMVGSDPLTAWGAGDVSTFPTGLDGLEFGVFGISIIEAVGKLAHDRFSHFRLGPGRTVSFGRFGRSTGIRLQRATQSPNSAEESAEIRQITAFARQWDGNYVNDIVPVGQGNGSTALTLFPLWALNGNFPGADPRFPIKRRVRWDFGGWDGYDYYLDTSNFSDSMTRYGLSQATYQQSSIGPNTPTNPEDMVLAAASLYSASIAHLQWYCQPHETITVTTTGHGDLRDLGGEKVRVVYREVNADGDTLRDINTEYYVTDLRRTWDDKGVGSDVWTLSSLGRMQEDGFTVFTGALQQLDDFRVTPMIYPTRESVYYDCLVSASHPASVYLDQDNSVVRMVEATFNVTCLPAVAPITSTDTASIAGAHFHNIIGTMPTNGVTGGSVDHSAPTNQHLHGHGSATIQGASAITANGGQNSHAHGSSVPASGGGIVNNSGIIGGESWHYHLLDIAGDNGLGTTGNNVWYQSNGNGLAMANAGSPQVKTSAQEAVDLTPTNHGHGSSVPATGGGTVNGNPNGGFQPTTNGYGGLFPSVDSAGSAGFTPSINSHGVIGTFGQTNVNPYLATAYTTSTDGAHVHKMSYGYYQDPSGTASGVTILVNGVRVDTQFAGTPYAVGPYNGSFVVDLAYIGAIPVQGAVKIDFTSATFGRLLIRGKVRRHETTVNAHT